MYWIDVDWDLLVAYMLDQAYSENPSTGAKLYQWFFPWLLIIYVIRMTDNKHQLGSVPTI